MYSMFSFDQLPLKRDRLFNRTLWIPCLSQIGLIRHRGSGEEFKIAGYLFWLLRYYLPTKKGEPLI